MGYGFLIFESKESAENALKILKDKNMPNSDKTFKLNHASFNDRKNENQHSLYVCDLNHSIKADELISFFKSKYKSVTGGKIIIDPTTKLSKGYGFVTFSDEKEKEKAINEMNGKILKEKAIKTGNAWHKKENRYKNKSKNPFHQNNNSFNQLLKLYNNPYFLANSYYANFFNPLFQKQISSHLEDYYNNNNNNEDGNEINDFKIGVTDGNF